MDPDNLSLSQILQAIDQLKSLDWNGLENDFKGTDPVVDALVAADDIAKVVSFFVPQAAIAAVVLACIIEIAKNTQPISPYSIPGYHWDALYGWVKDEKESK